MYFQFNLLSVF